jgi:hypothetical protein
MFQGAVHKTQRELNEMQRQIDQGLLPKNAIEQYRLDEETAVFGEGFKRDAQGRPLEMGKGSAAQPTSQSVEAYRRYGKNEPAYTEHLAKMEGDLAAHTAKQPRQAAAARR